MLLLNGFVFLIRNIHKKKTRVPKTSQANCVFTLTSSYKPAEVFPSITCACDLNEDIVLGFAESVSCGICVITKHLVRFPFVFLSKPCINQINYSVSATVLLKVGQLFFTHLPLFCFSSKQRQSKNRDLINNYDNIYDI